MVSLHQVIQARRMLSMSGFSDPGFLSSAIYTFGEASEVLDLVHQDLQPRDLRIKPEDAIRCIDKKLGQVVFMAFTTLARCGNVMVNIEYDRTEPKMSNLNVAMQMCQDALDAMEGANKGNVRTVENYMTEVIAWAYLLATRYKVDLEKAMWAWVAEIQSTVRSEYVTGR